MYLYLIEKYDMLMVVVRPIQLMFALHLIHINIVPTIRKIISITATKATRVIQQFGNENKRVTDYD